MIMLLAIHKIIFLSNGTFFMIMFVLQRKVKKLKLKKQKKNVETTDGESNDVQTPLKHLQPPVSTDRNSNEAQTPLNQHQSPVWVYSVEI